MLESGISCRASMVSSGLAMRPATAGWSEYTMRDKGRFEKRINNVILPPFKNHTYLPAGLTTLSVSRTHTDTQTHAHTPCEHALRMLICGLWKPPSVSSCPDVTLSSTLPLKMRNAVLGSSSNQCSLFLLAWPGNRAMERGCEDRCPAPRPGGQAAAFLPCSPG